MTDMSLGEVFADAGASLAVLAVLTFFRERCSGLEHIQPTTSFNFASLTLLALFTGLLLPYQPPERAGLNLHSPHRVVFPLRLFFRHVVVVCVPAGLHLTAQN